MIARALQAIAGHGFVILTAVKGASHITYTIDETAYRGEGATIVEAFTDLWLKLYPDDTDGARHAETCELCDGLVGLARERAELHGNANVRLSCFASTRGRGRNDQTAAAEVIEDRFDESVRAATPQEAMAGLLAKLNGGDRGGLT